MGELIAWQAGVDWARAGFATDSVLIRPVSRLAELFGPEVAEARVQLAPAIFDYWFRRGMADTVAPPVL